MTTMVTHREDMVSCKACGKPVVAEFSVEITDTKAPDGENRIIMGGKITGMRIKHDCMPVVTR